MIDLVIISLYLLVILGVSIYFGLHTKTMRDYSVANKSYSTPIMIAAMVGTTIGGGSTLGLAEQVFKVGLVGVLTYFAFVIELILTATFIVPRIAQFKDAISPGDVMERFYGKSGRVITGIAGTFKCIASIGGQIFAVGLLLQYFFGVSHTLAVIVGSIVVAIYSALGGIKAVTLTDVVQSVVLIIAMPMICNIGLIHIGGYANLFSAVPSSHMSLLPDDITNLKYLSLFLIGAIPTLSPAIFQRLLVAKDTRQLRISVWSDAGIVAGIILIVTCIGFIALVMKPDLNPNMAIPYLIDTILPPGLRGFVLVGMVAVIMSMADSYLNVAAITFVHDVVKPLKKKPLADKAELRLTQVATFCFGIAGVGVALYFPNVFSIVMRSRSLWVPLITIPLLAGLFGLSASRRTFFIGMLGGAVGGIAWFFTFEKYVGLDSIFIGLLSHAVAFFMAHRFDKERRRLKFGVPRIWVTATQIPNKLLPKLKTALSFRPSLEKLLNFSSRRVEAHGAQYTAFGLFAPLIYIIPYGSWSTTNETLQSYTIILKFLGGFLALYLVVRDRWPEKLKRYLPLYWHITLLYTLSFLMVFMTLESGASWASIGKLLLGLLLLGVLVDWLSFVIIMGLGVALAAGAFALVGDFSALSIESSQVEWAIYMYGFAIAIGMIFCRNKENQIMETLMMHKKAYGSMLHEFNFPLLRMSTMADGLNNHLPKLIKSHETAQKAGLSVDSLSEEHLEALRTLPADVKIVSDCSLTVIDMMLVQLKGVPTVMDSERCSVSECIESALAAYPFRPIESNLLSRKNSMDFEVCAQRPMVVHVLFNLIKNSLHQIKKAKRGEISIWTEQDRAGHRLHFRDTAAGIDQDKVDLIFNAFYTGELHGRGLGLHFCREVMRSVGGKITCHSEKGVYAEFVLTFPTLEKIENEIHSLL